LREQLNGDAGVEFASPSLNGSTFAAKCLRFDLDLTEVVLLSMPLRRDWGAMFHPLQHRRLFIRFVGLHPPAASA
jgi:hypothetical protein